MKNIDPTRTKSWILLQKHLEKIKTLKIKKLFDQNPNRFNEFSILFNNQILVDISKNRITKDTINKLCELAEEIDLKNAINDMFFGKKINRTENRAVLHTALRNCSNRPIILDDKDVMPKINKVLHKMKCFSQQVISGEYKGYTGKTITDIVNIGIGGSNLGPLMVTEALKPYKNHLQIHFVSNVDGTHIIETLRNLDLESTLFLIASKTFTTQETMINACSAKNWFLKSTNNEKHIKKHFIALSANYKAAIEFGINIDNIFEFWDWVGGRYSLWSSIGLSIVLSIGFENFEQLLHGGYAMDNHFLTSPIEKNIPILLALISIWYANFFDSKTEAILPYDQHMKYFPAYIQQICMESNGKSVNRKGKKINYQTSPVIWGDSGINGQHSFYQLIHQGKQIIPCDFIASAISHNPLGDHHLKLLSNFFAQTNALAFGKLDNIVKKELININNFIKNTSKIPFKSFEGNRPTNSILLRKITPYNLGILIALYEHKIFSQGIILNIFSFDQWGVELGKELADKIFPELKKNNITNNYDSSTNSLINYYKSWR